MRRKIALVLVVLLVLVLFAAGLAGLFLFGCFRRMLMFILKTFFGMLRLVFFGFLFCFFIAGNINRVRLSGLSLFGLR